MFILLVSPIIDDANVFLALSTKKLKWDFTFLARIPCFNPMSRKTIISGYRTEHLMSNDQTRGENQEPKKRSPHLSTGSRGVGSTSVDQIGYEVAISPDQAGSLPQVSRGDPPRHYRATILPVDEA